MIKVFGHKAPDTDSTGSPIIWAWYLSEVRKEPAVAVLQGEPNTEAAWMLSKWNLPKPEIITAEIRLAVSIPCAIRPSKIVSWA